MGANDRRDSGVAFGIDWIRCDGYGLCGDLAPHLIELDDWRYPILPRGPLATDEVGDAQRAVDCCPMRALTLNRVSPPVAAVSPAAAAARR